MPDAAPSKHNCSLDSDLIHHPVPSYWVVQMYMTIDERLTLSNHALGRHQGERCQKEIE